MRLFAMIAAILVPSLSFAQVKVSEHIEVAARMNVAENVCDINFANGVTHHTMMGAAEMRIDLNAAALLADARHTQILAYLNRTHRLDEFCANARAGNL